MAHWSAAALTEATAAASAATFAVVVAQRAEAAVVDDPETGIDFSRVVHGEEGFVLHRPVVAGDVLVPTEDVIEIRRGKKVTSERRFMPGYVLVHMDLSDRTHHLVNSINRVTGFLGAQGKPMPMRDDEVNAILHRSGEGGAEVAPRNLIRFEVGENVNVTDGPFEGFAGMVEEVDDAAGRVKVTVSIFGRPTPVELEFTQVAKTA